jgi:dipeptidyl aminopeptidase/acylaminoacyl peptidase
LLAAAVTVLFPYTPASAAAAVSLTVQAGQLNVRRGPSTAYPVIAELHADEQVTATGRNAGAGWYQVQLADGTAGWVSAAYVQTGGNPAALPVIAVPAPAAGPTARSPAAGSHIVFQTSSGGDIYVANSDGSGLRYLTTGIDPALSPDGRMVAFTRWPNGDGNGALGSVWVINIDGTGERKVEGFVRQPKSPTWSPDGRQLVINMQHEGTLSSTWTCFVNGKVESNLPNPITGAPCMQVPADPHWGLRLINLADGTFRDLPRATYSFSPTWDPVNSNLVVFHGDHGLMVVDLAQNTVYPLTTDVDQRSPTFSPDGTKLALCYQQDDHWEVHVVNADGSGEVRLTETPSTVIANQLIQGKQPVQWNNAAPAWSPDGSRIAFITDRNGPWEIWVMNANGTDQHPLITAAMLKGLSIQYHGVDERVISWR